MLDFPDPFGPEITVNPGSNGTAVVPPKDLKWDNSTRLMYTYGKPIQIYYRLDFIKPYFLEKIYSSRFEDVG